MPYRPLNDVWPKEPSRLSRRPPTLLADEESEPLPRKGAPDKRLEASGWRLAKLDESRLDAGGGQYCLAIDEG